MKSNEAFNAFLTPGYDTRLNASRLLKEAGAGADLPLGRIVKGHGQRLHTLAPFGANRKR